VAKAGPLEWVARQYGGCTMMWPWEQFDWGVFWAVLAAFFVRGFSHMIQELMEVWKNREKY
jgi:hypothetical protein